jgi:uncharacterized protein YprB with RNaseH-like and TPR domain
MELYIDIESIPSDVMPELSDVKVPGNYSKPETILKYQEEHLVDEYKKQALDSMKGRIFCLGYAVGEHGSTGGIEVATGTEHEILAKLEAILFVDPRFSGSKTWVGWNVETFDIPWLWRKAVQHGFDQLRKVIPKGNRPMICDLMRVWAADFKDFSKMSDVAKFLGIPHSDVSGSDVYDLWKAGDTAAIVKHCQDDIETCINIHRRIC